MAFFSTFVNIFRVPELRRKILFTFGLLCIYRIGFAVPLPGIDQAVFAETGKGLVVLLGCAHAGVINTLDYAVKLAHQNHIYTVIGGMHLLNASPERIERTIDTFKHYNVQKIRPAHCTGNNAVEKLKQTFAERCSVCCAGSRMYL